jgi:hypothetical protein
MLQYCSVSIAFITTDKNITPAQTSYPSCKIDIGKEKKKQSVSFFGNRWVTHHNNGLYPYIFSLYTCLLSVMRKITGHTAVLACNVQSPTGSKFHL